MFLWNNQNTKNYNILLLTQYYTRNQHQHFTNILKTNFHQEQMKNTRYIPPPQTIPLCQIHINKCNLDDDIAYTQGTIQTQHNTTHIYDNTSQHVITIP